MTSVDCHPWIWGGRRGWALALVLFVNLAAKPAPAGRITLSLDGTWQIEDSRGAEDFPRQYHHTVAVPGLVHNSQPAFADVDQYDSRELIDNRIRAGRLPSSAAVSNSGVARQDRNYFWHRRTFTVPVQRTVAILRINKAQFGTTVWVNGRKVGEYPGCFSAGEFNVTDAMKWTGENELLVRIGAHPGVLPEGYPFGTDFEKLKWTPGIYDSVSLILADNPLIKTIQVAPNIWKSEILIQTRLKNYGVAQTIQLEHTVSEWKGKNAVVRAKPERIQVQAGEERVVLQTLAIPRARLWSPESPSLYVLDSSSGGDSARTRFGMREIRFDTPTRRAWLNGKVYFLRGSNITMHRFFEDPLSGSLPWDEKWVRRLLVDLPRQMHWNSFRFCIGPVPDKWLDIADEAGLLIQNEFFVWTGAPDWHPNYTVKWNAPEMIRQYGDWMRDNWNHPSVAIWDANNETLDDVFGKAIIPAVRGLDLSNRAWENSYNLPVGPDDPVEEHPYLMHSMATSDDGSFKLENLETMSGNDRSGSSPDNAHPAIINEYGWLWLNRDGSPTLLTDKLYPKLLGSSTTAEERMEYYAYLLAGKTEFWRGHRQYAGILHFVYLTCSYPGVYTADHFRDVVKLQLDPYFADYVGEAFKPLGVYLNFWHSDLEAGSRRDFRVMMVNDHDQTRKGTLSLTLEDAKGRELARTAGQFQLAPQGQMSYELSLAVPAEASGKCLLRARATPEGTGLESTTSRRKVTVIASNRK